MGQNNTKTHFTSDQLWDYRTLTFLKTNEVARIHEMFLDLAGISGITEPMEAITLTPEDVYQIPQIKLNPFRDRICKVFASNKNGTLSFEDFLEMMSAFSENASPTVKIGYAFRIYDMNGNNYIDEDDLRHIILRLTKGMMNEANIQILIHYIMEEGDLNNDSMLSFSEFENVINKSPDFQKSFTLRL